MAVAIDTWERWLPAAREAVPALRHALADALTARGLDGLTDVACLLASELLTNAVTHPVWPQTLVAIRLEADDIRMRVSVLDNDSRVPILMHPDSETTWGRGIGIVDALSARWGVDEPSEENRGLKTVWFELDRT